MASGDYLFGSGLSTKYKNLLFVGGSGYSAGLDATLRACNTDNGSGGVNAAPFTLSTAAMQFSTSKEVQFRQTTEKVYSSSAGILDLAAAGEIQLATVLLDINATGDITIDTTDTTDGIKIGTVTSGVPITLGHSTSEVMVKDNLVVEGTTTQKGAFTLASTIPIQFVDANEYISGDSSNMTIGSSGRIDLTATSDVRIPTDVGLQFVSASNYLEYVSGSSQLAIVSGGALNTTAAAASTITTTDGTLTIHADGADDKVHIKGDHATGTAIDIQCTHADGDLGIRAGATTGNITVTAGSSSTGLFNLDGYQFDMDAGSGGIAIDSTGTIGIGVGANAGAISIGTNTTARDITIGHQTSTAGLDLYAGTGKLTATSTGEIEIVSTKNGASSMYLRANGGTSETLHLLSSQGTGAGSITVTSTAGGIDVNAAKGMTIDTADTTTFLMAANNGSARYFSLDATNAGGGAAGVKIGTTSGTTITIGHTTSETTVSDNLTVTGNLSVSGTQTYTDLAISDTTPTLISTNTTEENADGGRESIWSFKGEKADGTATTIATIRADHQGSSDDYKGQLFFNVNTDSGATATSTAIKITSDLKSTFSGMIEGDAGLTIDGAASLINQGNGDYDLKVGSTSTDTLIFGDAGNNRVGINEASPSGTFQVGGTLICGTGGELTISSGAITVTHSYHTVDTQSDASTDDLDTISGGVAAGQILTIIANNTARSVVAKDGTGNLKLAGDFTMDNVEDTLMLVYDGSNWLEVSRSGNGA
jgi:hypothetical protein